jgi:glycosyltransferase involved in cell wall biosynthesis
MQLKSWAIHFTISVVKVSVLIPAYNSGQYLNECLESVLNQDFKDMEILISDDRSTDDTLKIIERFAVRDERIRWWQNPENLRQLHNHNTLLREAQGEYIKIVHSDDILISPLSIAKMAAMLDRNPTVSLVSSACELIDSTSHSRADDRRNFFSAGVWAGKRVIKSSFEFQVAANYIGEPSLVMFRRSQALRGFSKDHDYVLDLEMWFYLLEQGDFAYLPETLCGYRQHPTQLSKGNSYGKNEVELLKLLETYWAKSWVGGMATQRMMASQIRFLKKNRAKFGSHADRADALLAQIQNRTNPVSRAFFWLEHKAHRSSKKKHDRAVRNVFQRCKESDSV